MNSFPLMALADCCEIVSGATPSTSVEEYWGGEVCWVTPKDLSDLDGYSISDTPRKLTNEGLSSCAASILPPGSVLFSSRAPIGHVAINTVPMATNQGFKSFVPKADKLDAKFLFYWLRANRFYLENLGVGATFKEVSKAIVSKIKVPVPPLPEQRRIAAILDHADALRAKRWEALAQLDELQRTIFVEMFGDPVTSPKGCVSSTLGDCVEEMQYGPRFYNEAYSEEGVRIVRITDLNTAGSLDFDAMPRMDVDAETQTKFVLSAGDIVFARTGATVGKVALMREGDPPCIAGAYFIRMRFQKHIIPEYAYSVLQSSSVQSLIAGQSRQAAQQNFSGPGLRRLPMPIPALERQTQFAQRLEAIRNEKIKHLNGLGLVNDLFSSLQHRAFRGEL